MQCPVCTDVSLAMTNREGIEIDYCPKCRGVWLDRGELDKIIERSAAQYAPSAGVRPGEPADRERYDEERYAERRYDERHPHHSKKKRRGLLGDLFDFD